MVVALVKFVFFIVQSGKKGISTLRCADIYRVQLCFIMFLKRKTDFMITDGVKILNDSERKYPKG